ncbi:MAG: hypothetical protein ND866_11810 [Pyrinomonadaceae bacterium]|nr:hypothetical protein [Pyrinomonadaceae bacterium]
MAISSQKIPLKLFSAEEIQRHAASLPLITTTAASYLDDIYADHVNFYKKWRVSKYYGDRRKDYATKAGRVKALESYGKPASLADQLVGTACIRLAMDAVKSGLLAAGMESTWKNIHDILKIDNLLLGTDLQVMLRQLGWKIYYWNPNPDKNAEWDAEDRALNPLKPGKTWNAVCGGHAAHYNTATNSRVYGYGKIPVDNAQSLVGFGTTPPPEFRKVPFFIGTAHDGYHVFPGRRGDVIEAHSMRDLNAFDNLEISPFNPLKSGGGPRWAGSQKYRSGLIAVPQAF